MIPNSANLFGEFARSAASNAETTAIFWGDAEYTYGQLHRQASWLAGWFQREFGVRRGQRVGIWLRNRPEYVSVIFGILGAGAVVVPINNFLKPDEVSHILDDAGIEVLVSDDSMAEMLAKLKAARPALRFARVEEFQPGTDASLTVVGTNRGDLAVLIYTSGTTGRPKGAMLSHGNLLHNVASCRHVLEAANLDRFALVLPMFHSFMFTVCILLPLLVGGSIVLIKSLHPAKNILHEMIQHRATILAAIPQLFRALASATLPPGLPLRLCLSGAAPLPLEILSEFNARLPGLPLIEGYGLSEASPVVTLNPIRGAQRPGSIGLPILEVEVSIRNDRGEALPVGETGEICVRGGNVMAGYWNQPEETAVALRSGWLFTGDIGRMDADGYTYITDRKKDMLLVNGNNVYPREIEEVLYQFPGVREAAVIGRPDARKGEQPVAFVAANEGACLDPAALHEFLRERLADYKVPRQIVELPQLPRNATGKILKTNLRGWQG